MKAAHMTFFIFMGREELISLLLELAEWHKLPMMKKLRSITLNQAQCPGNPTLYLCCSSVPAI